MSGGKTTLQVLHLSFAVGALQSEQGKVVHDSNNGDQFRIIASLIYNACNNFQTIQILLNVYISL